MAGICEPHKWMTEKLVAEINAAGGIAGKPVVTEFCDSAVDPTKAAACEARAIDSGALATNGPLERHGDEGDYASCRAGRRTLFIFGEHAPTSLPNSSFRGPYIRWCPQRTA